MTGGRAAILTYHSLDTSGSVISVAPALFRRQMEDLAAGGTRVVPLSAIRTTPGAVALTFDDGFRNFLDHALPVLRACRFPATVFAVAGYCGKQNDWPSQPAGIPRLSLMDWAELRALAREGIALGAHTVNHPRLTMLPDEQVLGELRRSRAAIEERTGARVDTLAYPYGLSDARVRALAAGEFSLACGTSLAFVGPESDPFGLPRIDAFYLRDTAALLTAAGAVHIRVRGLLRRLRSAVLR